MRNKYGIGIVIVVITLIAFPVTTRAQTVVPTPVPGYPTAPAPAQTCGNYGYCGFIPTPGDLILPTVPAAIPAFLVRQDEIDLANRTIQMYKFANSQHLIDLILFLFVALFALAMLFKFARSIGKN